MNKLNEKKMRNLKDKKMKLWEDSRTLAIKFQEILEYLWISLNLIHNKMDHTQFHFKTNKTNKKLFHIGYYVHLFMLLIIFPTLRPCYIN